VNKPLISAALAALCVGGCGKADHPTYIPGEPDLLVQACSGCHSADNRVISNLKDWSDREISEALLRYKTEDGTTVMHRLARGYSIEDIETIAGTYKSADE